MTNKISTLTICQDEEQYITQMLEYLHTYVNPDEMIIVDGGSKDTTLELIHMFINANPTATVNLYQREMPLSFSEQRNFALQQCNGDWVLHIDADETYSQNLRELILAIREGKYENVDGFLFPTTHFIQDDKHMTDDGGDTHIRLFRKKSDTKYVGDVHEKPNIEGVILPMNSIALRHYSMLKNEEGLLNKGKRWIIWGDQTNHLGIHLNGENHFVNAVKNFTGKLYDVPKEWK